VDKIYKAVSWLTLLFVLALSLGAGGPARAEASPAIRELNFVYLHGMGGDACSLQLLADKIAQQLPARVTGYEVAYPGNVIETDAYIRCYPNDVDIGAWASNVAEAVNRYFAGKKNLVIIGHSMGGKAALYTVAHNVGGLADRTAMVVTINSPVKSLEGYYLVAGATASDYYKTIGMVDSHGVLNSAVYYDSAADGLKVGEAKHWLALISGEAAPSSPLYDTAGVDPFPRDQDDEIVPLSAQYADGADVVYYGEHEHSEFGREDDLADRLAQQILTYIFGGDIACSMFAGSGGFEHKADWVPGTDYWRDTTGEISSTTGTIAHFNPSFTRWQEYEDVVGEDSPTPGTRSSYAVTPQATFPVLARFISARWYSPDDLSDGRIIIKTRLAPRNTVRLAWKVYQRGMLPAGVVRNHYEVQITTGTPFTNIPDVAWASADTRDIRLRVFSNADSPFRWFQGVWRVYYTEVRFREVVSELK